MDSTSASHASSHAGGWCREVAHARRAARRAARRGPASSGLARAVRAGPCPCPRLRLRAPCTEPEALEFSLHASRQTSRAVRLAQTTVHSAQTGDWRLPRSGSGRLSAFRVLLYCTYYSIGYLDLL